jgi:protein-disulfide isomerase
MRFLSLSFVLTLALSSTAFAEAAAPKQKEMIKANGENTINTAMYTGGKSASPIVTGAPLSTDFVMGDPKAPIVMIDYVSMTCPHCAHLTNAVMPEIEKKYVQTGKVAYVLRQFPINPPALQAALLLDCVGVQDTNKYYTFARVLFDAQDKWAFDANYAEGLATIANVGGVSREEFNACVSDTDREVKILKQKKDAIDELQIPHTPYIFIDGEVFEGDRTVEGISQFIDSKLAAKRKM